MERQKPQEFLRELAESLRSRNRRRPVDSVRLREVYGMLHTEDEIHESKCGFGSFRPGWMQLFARKEFYILLYCATGITVSMFFTYTTSVLSTLEKRFRLTSKQTGIFLSGNDISQAILAIILGYYGNYGNRPKWLGVGFMLAAISGLAAALPHFYYGPGQEAMLIAKLSASYEEGLLDNITNVAAKEKKEELCSFHPDTCQEEEDSERGTYVGTIVIFFLAQFFAGIASALFFSIGVAYLDDNVNKRVYPIYYAITFLLRVSGPAAGFFLGGKCLSMWIVPSKKPGIDMKDPRWYGAWWLGYLIIGSILFTCGALMLFFPKKLPATLRREAKRVVRQEEQDRQQGSEKDVEYYVSIAKEKKQNHEKPSIRNLRSAFRRLYTNPIWSATMINTILSMFAISAYYTFKPKYLESQFRKSASDASYYTGTVSLCTVVIGCLISGSVMRWVRPPVRYVTGYNIVITLVTTASFFCFMFIGCPKYNMVGPSDESAGPACSSSCGCSERYMPMCSQDGSTLFYSPCFAGCSVANSTVKPTVFSDCKCISNSSDPLNLTSAQLSIGSSDKEYSSSPLGFGTRGYCKEPCNTFVYYVVIEAIVKIVGSTGRVGNTLIYMRCTSDEDKSLSLAMMVVFLSIFAAIPAPIVMGAILDKACRVWDNSCGSKGNCWLYDSDQLRYIIHLFPGIVYLISVLGDIVVHYYNDRLDLYGDRDDSFKPSQRQNTPEEMEKLDKTNDNKTAVGECS